MYGVRWGLGEGMGKEHPYFPWKKRGGKAGNRWILFRGQWETDYEVGRQSARQDDEEMSDPGTPLSYPV